MRTLINYARSRYFQKSHGWGRTWFRWLWLDALSYAMARYCTLLWPGFRIYCRRVDRLFRDQHDWPRSYTADTGLDCWIDHYWDGESPQDAVDSEVEHWEG